MIDFYSGKLEEGKAVAYHLDVRPALDNWQVDALLSSLSPLCLASSSPLCLASLSPSSLSCLLLLLLSTAVSSEAWCNTAASCARPVKCAWSLFSTLGVALVFLTPVVS